VQTQAGGGRFALTVTDPQSDAVAAIHIAKDQWKAFVEMIEPLCECDTVLDEIR